MLCSIDSRVSFFCVVSIAPFKHRSIPLPRDTCDDGGVQSLALFYALVPEVSCSVCHGLFYVDLLIAGYRFAPSLTRASQVRITKLGTTVVIIGTYARMWTCSWSDSEWRRKRHVASARSQISQTSCFMWIVFDAGG